MHISTSAQLKANHLHGLSFLKQTASALATRSHARACACVSFLVFVMSSAFQTPSIQRSSRRSAVAVARATDENLDASPVTLAFTRSEGINVFKDALLSAGQDVVLPLSGRRLELVHLPAQHQKLYDADGDGDISNEELKSVRVATPHAAAHLAVGSTPPALRQSRF